MAKTATNHLGIYPWKMPVRPISIVSIFMAVTAKKVTEKAKKWAKRHKFGLKCARMAGSTHCKGVIFSAMSMGNYVLCQVWSLPDF